MKIFFAGGRSDDEAGDFISSLERAVQYLDGVEITDINQADVVVYFSIADMRRFYPCPSKGNRIFILISAKEPLSLPAGYIQWIPEDKAIHDLLGFCAQNLG